MYSEEFWDALVEEGNLHELHDAYLAHDARGLPVPLYVLEMLDNAGYAVGPWKDEDDGQPDEAKEWEDFDKDC